MIVVVTRDNLETMVQPIAKKLDRNSPKSSKNSFFGNQRVTFTCTKIKPTKFSLSALAPSDREQLALLQIPLNAYKMDLMS